jgi:fucose 4-O-acetylase-like acetyltransferase
MGRDRAIDAAKGIAIVAIVVGHVLRGLAGAGIADTHTSWYFEADSALYLFHLGVFVLLAAVFVPRGVERAGSLPYLRRRAVELVWLYVLWSVLQLLVKLATGTLVNTPTDVHDLLAIGWAPMAQFWFLPFLLLVTIGTVLVRPWEGGVRAALGLVLGLGVSLVAWSRTGPVNGTIGLGLTAFFVVGSMLGPERLRRGLGRPVAVLAGAAAVLVVAYVALLVLADPLPPTTQPDPPTPANVALGVVASVVGVLAVLVLAALLAPGAAGRGLAYLGERSLPIFLAHIIFASGTRIVLEKAGLEGLAVHLVLGTLAGIVGSLLLYAASRALGWTWLFGAPRAGGPRAVVTAAGRIRS